MRSPGGNGNGEEAEILGLRALGWVLSDDSRASRLLALTGLDADQLRARVGDPVLLTATAEFLAAHEPDLLACAEALDVPPEQLAALTEGLSA